MMGSYNGFAFTVPAGQRIHVPGFDARSRRLSGWGITVPGRALIVSGRTVYARSRQPQRYLLVIARDLLRATEIARSKVLAAVFVKAGPDILDQARELGIREDDAGIYDG